ncbi:hypothetical protein LAZ67_10000293 [Cordylochernes scorpioides]|uniref:HTH CENPB-type domain-containing protein n=1 Tax=Cordylochernes scorpioides TaxID=51811 RepID=A0ABY6KVG7_9ARAC|nr:hypothetical protein LAZ67_10000293 [Cordylochernes scorpioides]
MCDNNKKQKRSAISLETKIIILDCLAKGERSTAIGKRYNLGESTIRAIKKNEAAIRRSVRSGTNLSSKISSYSRGTLIEKTEKALVIWIEDLTQKRIPLDGHLIKMKALKFYKELKESEPSTSSRESNPQFSASTGWLTGFIKRHSFHNLKIKGEVASADEEAARKYPEKLAKIIKDGGYCAHQIFNADETGLFWKKMPTRTYIAKSEKNASGFKAAKDRVTLLLCSNASGDRMLKPLLVNRSLKPRALKGKDLNTLPVHWMANKKAWVTTAIFTEWFNKCFVPEVENYMKEMGLEFKILLILDNAPGHPNLEHPNIKVVFFPPNTTSLIQPLDQGIISTFKKYYVKFTFQFIFDKLESDTITVTEVWKQFNILNCVDHVALAIAEIKSQTLNACWKAAWPECVSKKNESNRTTIVTSDIISIAKEIGGEGFDDFGEHDIEELLVDEALNDDDILESMVDTTKDFETVDSELEDVTPLDEKLLREGLQLSGKLENFFIQNDNDVERALKFQRDLKFCMSGYRELYKELVKPSQRLITDYLVKEKKITEVPKEALPCRSDDVILSSSDESDLAPILKRVVSCSAIGIITLCVATAGEQGEVQKKLDQIQAEIEKQDQDIHHLQRQLKEAEHILSTAIYQAKQKLQAIHKAAERSVSSEELIKYAHRISSCNAIAAPHNWQPGDPRRPYPTDLEMRMGFLGRMSDLSPASGAHLLPPAAPIPTQSAPQDLPPGGRQAKPRYPGEPSSFTWQGQQPPQQPPFQPPTAAAAVEKAAKDNEDVEVMSTDSSSSSSSDSQ